MDQNIINTREDLDAAQGTPAYDTFMAYLKGSMSYRQDTAQYPDGYNQPGYEGPKLEPIWEDVEDLSTIERFRFTKSDFA